MAEEVKKNIPVGVAEDHSLIQDYLQEYEEDKKYFEIALLIALLFHLVLIWAKLPDFGSKQIVEEKKVEKKPVRVVLPPPPEKQLEKLQIEKKVKKIPIPDPTPDEPEPEVPIETNVQQDISDVDSEYMVGDLPDEPPVPSGPISEATVGLEKPKYSRKQLMANVIYPELGKKAGLQGIIILQAVLKKDGTVGDIRVIGGNLRNYPFFRQAAINAVKKLKFTPGKLRGHPVDVIMTLTIRFKLKTSYSR